MSETPQQGKERINLLICYTCKTIEEIPYTYDGEYIDNGRYDQSNNPFIEPVASPHDKKGCKGRLADTDKFYWLSQKGRKQVVDELVKQFTTGSTGLDAFGTDFYNVKATFSNDAMNCYALHMRPKDGCSDYKSDKKILKPGTDAERKELGMGASNVKSYLCDFCVVKSTVQKKFYTAKGFYK